MSKSKIFGTFLLIFSISSGTIGSSKSIASNKSIQPCILGSETGAIGSNCHSSIPTSKTTFSNNLAPSRISAVVYDIVCFATRNQDGCDSDSIYKIQRGTNITAYFKQVTSVQQGTKSLVSFKNDRNQNSQKITISEMESLSSRGAEVYILFDQEENFLVPGTSGRMKRFVVVSLFNRKSGKFQEFDYDVNAINFKIGNTKIRKIPLKSAALKSWRILKNYEFGK
jgi:hypothetical protein